MKIDRRRVLGSTSLLLILVSLLIVTTTIAKPREKQDRVLFSYPYEEYLPDECSSEPQNFADYPADFSSGTVPWDLDLIDAEAVSFDGEGIYVAVLDTRARA